MCVDTDTDTHTYAGVYGDQKRVSSPLKLLQLPELVSHLMWVLRIKLRISGRTVGAHKH